MKYEALTNYLNKSGQDRVRLSYAQMEDILGFRVGRSPRNHRAWWGNGGHSHAGAWMDVG